MVPAAVVRAHLQLEHRLVHGALHITALLSHDCALLYSLTATQEHINAVQELFPVLPDDRVHTDEHYTVKQALRQC